MKRKTKLQTNAINPVSLTIISPSSTPIDDSETLSLESASFAARFFALFGGSGKPQLRYRSKSRGTSAITQIGLSFDGIQERFWSARKVGIRRRYEQRRSGKFQGFHRRLDLLRLAWLRNQRRIRDSSQLLHSGLRFDAQPRKSITSS